MFLAGFLLSPPRAGPGAEQREEPAQSGDSKEARIPSPMTIHRGPLTSHRYSIAPKYVLHKDKHLLPECIAFALWLLEPTEVFRVVGQALPLSFILGKDLPFPSVWLPSSSPPFPCPWSHIHKVLSMYNLDTSYCNPRTFFHFPSLRKLKNISWLVSIQNPSCIFF